MIKTIGNRNIWEAFFWVGSGASWTWGLDVCPICLSAHCCRLCAIADGMHNCGPLVAWSIHIGALCFRPSYTTIKLISSRVSSPLMSAPIDSTFQYMYIHVEEVGRKVLLLSQSLQITGFPSMDVAYSCS